MIWFKRKQKQKPANYTVTDLYLSMHDDSPTVIKLKLDTGAIINFNFEKQIALQLADAIFKQWGKKERGLCD